MIIDAWMQHPSAEFLAEPMVDSLRRWARGRPAEGEIPVGRCAGPLGRGGPDGTTMARIAERAGINKERLYKYFGDKQALFETVLTDELAASVARWPGAC